VESRLRELPALKVIDSVVAARHYNRVRLALARLENPLRFPLPHLRGLDMVLNDQEWVCVDRTLNDLPVLAWTDFQRQDRIALHAPIACRLRFFHAYAGLIVGTLLQDVAVILAERLNRARPPVKRSVTPLSRTRHRR
jgi:hypothetical protein